MYSADPYEDLSRWEQEELDNEKLFPKCSCCGATIYSETYFTIDYMNKTLIFCHDCMQEKMTENYIEERS